MEGWGWLKRGVADCRRSHPREGAGGGHPSYPARGYGGALCYFYTEILPMHCVGSFRQFIQKSHARGSCTATQN